MSDNWILNVPTLCVYAYWISNLSTLYISVYCITQNHSSLTSQRTSFPQYTHASVSLRQLDFQYIYALVRFNVGLPIYPPLIFHCWTTNISTLLQVAQSDYNVFTSIYTPRNRIPTIATPHASAHFPAAAPPHDTNSEAAPPCAARRAPHAVAGTPGRPGTYVVVISMYKHMMYIAIVAASAM